MPERYIELRVRCTNDFNGSRNDRSFAAHSCLIIISRANTHVTVDGSREPHDRRRNYASVKETNDPFSSPSSPLSCAILPLFREMTSAPKAGGGAPATGFQSRSRLSGRVLGDSACTVVNTVRDQPGDVLCLVCPSRIIGAGNGAEYRVMSHGIPLRVRGRSISKLKIIALAF